MKSEQPAKPAKKSTQKKPAAKGREPIKICFERTLGEDGDEPIIEAIERWLPAVEEQDSDINDLIWALLHHSVLIPEELDSYMGGWLSVSAQPKWRFNPWTGESMEDES